MKNRSHKKSPEEEEEEENKRQHTRGQYRNLSGGKKKQKSKK